MQSIYLHLASTNRGDSIVEQSCHSSRTPIDFTRSRLLRNFRSCGARLPARVIERIRVEEKRKKNP